MDVEKALDKVQRALNDNISGEIKTRWSTPQNNKGYIWQIYIQHMKQRKIENIFSKTWNETRASALFTFIQYLKS